MKGVSRGATLFYNHQGLVLKVLVLDKAPDRKWWAKPQDAIEISAKDLHETRELALAAK